MRREKLDPLVSDLQWNPGPEMAPPVRAGAAAICKIYEGVACLQAPFEAEVDCRDGAHVLVLALKSTAAVISLDGLTLHEGVMSAGALFACPPRQELYRFCFSQPASFLQVHVPRSFVETCYQEFAKPDLGASMALFEPHLSKDKMLASLVRCLTDFEARGGLLGAALTDGVCLVLAARLVNLHLQGAYPSVGRKVAALPSWRLRRVQDYVNAHIEDRIQLAELADVAGLSRMHFAIAFKAATGITPHNYILERRIEHSKQLLLNSKVSIAEVAAVVATSSQSHFTSLFKRFVGETPHRWRARHLIANSEIYGDVAQTPSSLDRSSVTGAVRL